MQTLTAFQNVNAHSSLDQIARHWHPHSGVPQCHDVSHFAGISRSRFKRER